MDAADWSVVRRSTTFRTTDEAKLEAVRQRIAERLAEATR